MVVRRVTMCYVLLLHSMVWSSFDVDFVHSFIYLFSMNTSIQTVHIYNNVIISMLIVIGQLETYNFIPKIYIYNIRMKQY